MATSPARCLSIILLAALVIISYSNSLHNSWHLDDSHTILKNPKLHLTEISADRIRDTFRAATAKGYYNSDRIYRPIPNFTFAVNWFFGKKDVTGYHIVNIAIHLLTAIFLYLTTIRLLQSPNVAPFSAASRQAVALLASAFWAVNPVQVAAVTYIVQRMALLCAFFSILAIWSYLNARLAADRCRKTIWGSACVLFFFMALGSKENAVLLPFNLALLELLFFQDIPWGRWRRLLPFRRIAPAAALLVIVAGILYLNTDLSHSITKTLDYSQRPFTLTERLLTEGRVLLLYLGLIFYPIANRFSIQHGIDISTGLLSPPTTIISIITILILLAFSVRCMKRHPLLSLPIMFFFLNHMIESSVIPLELTFEHRNYLPSFFLFLPLALGVRRGLLAYRERPAMKWLVAALTSLILIVCAMGTYSRNAVWATEETLWKDVIAKYPGTFRAAINLMQIEGGKQNWQNMAHWAQQTKELIPMAQNPIRGRAKYHGALAKLYYQKKEYTLAIENARKAVAAIPEFDRARRPLILSYVATGKWREAEQVVDHVLARRPKEFFYLKMKGFILLKTARAKAAASILATALQRCNFRDWQTALYLGAALDQCGKHKSARWWLERARALEPETPLPLLHLIRNALAASDKDRADVLGKELLRAFDLTAIKEMLSAVETDTMHPPLETKALWAYLSSALQRQIDDFRRGRLSPRAA